MPVTPVNRFTGKKLATLPEERREVGVGGVEGLVDELHVAVAHQGPGEFRGPGKFRFLDLGDSGRRGGPDGRGAADGRGHLGLQGQPGPVVGGPLGLGEKVAPGRARRQEALKRVDAGGVLGDRGGGGGVLLRGSGAVPLGL